MTTPFLGTIQPFAFNFAPQGWATCSGQTIAVNQNQALFALLGTTFGGNGTTNFGLPNLQGRTAIGAGQLAGGGNYALGQSAGTENATLLSNNLPSHTHSLMALNGAGTLSTPSGNVLGTVSGSTDGGDTVSVALYAPAGSMVPMAPASIGATGASSPFSILSPYLAVNMCIALQGVFPSRN